MEFPTFTNAIDNTHIIIQDSDCKCACSLSLLYSTWYDYCYMHIAVVYLEFEYPTYTTLESDVSIEVCVKLFSIDTETIHYYNILYIGTGEGTAGKCTKSLLGMLVLPCFLQ